TRGECVGRRQLIGRARRLYADAAPQVQVTLSGELLKHLRTESKARQIPLRWLVAGLVCDTMRTAVEPQSSHHVQRG
ncbi:MAG TPA: hypothetical protein VKA15_02665, partial [Isosphaeraceae bacterium]|nr:hypothetical protein [Isosphaeraceae bacterium]